MTEDSTRASIAIHVSELVQERFAESIWTSQQRQDSRPAIRADVGETQHVVVVEHETIITILVACKDLGDLPRRINVGVVESQCTDPLVVSEPENALF